MKEEVEKVIDEYIRPSLKMDGGDIELIGIDEENDIVKVRLVGACAGCPMSQFTALNVVEGTLKRFVKDTIIVETVI